MSDRSKRGAACWSMNHGNLYGIHAAIAGGAHLDLSVSNQYTLNYESIDS
jgi:hypothetical protein